MKKDADKAGKYKKIVASKEVVKLVYDIGSTPSGLNMADFTKLYEQHNVVFWDSSKGGTKPQLFSVSGKAPLSIVDTKDNEIDLEYYTKMFQEEEFWAKELHRCKNSPIYYFSNYGTSVWPHTDEDLKKYMNDLDLGAVVAKDDEEAKELWDKQKLKLQDAVKHITKEHLLERAAYIGVIKARYEQSVAKLQKLLSSKVRLVDSNNVDLPVNKQKGNIIQKLRKFLPVDPMFSEKYRTPKGKWDNSMLFVTSYEELLKMFYAVLKNNGQEPELVDSEPTDSSGVAVDSEQRESVAKV